MTKRVAKYKIHETFKITERGIVFAGVILEGEFMGGDVIKFDFNGEVLERKIIGIDNGMRLRDVNPNVGVMIECINEKEIDDLRNWNPKLTIGEIYSIK